MASTDRPAPRRRPLPAAVRQAARPPYREALLIVAIAIAMASVFAASYSLALGRPAPHHIAAGIVGRPSEQPKLVAALETATRGGLVLGPYPSTASVVHAIEEQHVYTALILTPGRPRLLIASAAGASVARLLEQAGEAAAAHTGAALQVSDVRPLPPGDPQGLVTFYVTLAATIFGFITMFQLRAHATPMSLRAWLGFIALLAFAGGLALTVLTGPVIGALHGPFGELWATLAAEITVAALVNSVLITLVGRWAIIPAWLLFVALGNASSGGAVAPPLLPPFYAFIGRFLPPGATVQAVHTAVYFPHTQHPEPFVVEAIWLATALATLLLIARVLHREPGRP